MKSHLPHCTLPTHSSCRKKLFYRGGEGWAVGSRRRGRVTSLTGCMESGNAMKMDSWPVVFFTSVNLPQLRIPVLTSGGADPSDAVVPALGHPEKGSGMRGQRQFFVSLQ